jgi:hypothetical protein
MRFSIDDRIFELGEVPHLPQGQQEFCNVVSQQSQWTVKELVDRMALKSPAPLNSRLEHLMQKGIVKELTPATV